MLLLLTVLLSVAVSPESEVLGVAEREAPSESEEVGLADSVLLPQSVLLGMSEGMALPILTALPVGLSVLVRVGELLRS